MKKLITMLTVLAIIVGTTAPVFAQTTIPGKTAVSTEARLHPYSGETEYWITTFSDGTKMRQTNIDFYYYGEYPAKYFIARTDFSDGLLDMDCNGIDDRDPLNGCGYTDLDFNCVADERQAYSVAHTLPGYFPGAECISVYSKCSHGIINECCELCNACSAELAYMSERFTCE